MLASNARRGNTFWMLFAVVMVVSTLSIAGPARSWGEYTVQEGLTLATVANFEEGVDKTWNYSWWQFAPRYWTTDGAMYSYTPGATGPVMATTTAADNVNYWDVYGNSNGVSGYTGYADMIYQLFIPTEGRVYPYPQYPYDASWTSNYQKWNGYTNLQLKWWGTNTNPAKNIVLQIWVYTQANGGQWVQISTDMYRAQNTMYTDNFSLSGLTSTQLSQISYIMFRVININITPGVGASAGYQRTLLAGIKLTSASSPTVSHPLGGYTNTSKFLGTVMHRRFSNYSATGFFDNAMCNPGKFKIWLGGGIPERNSSDNVWYVETTTLDQSVLKSSDLKTTRCTLTPTNILVYENGVNWCWGDPSVIRFMSSWNPPSCVYYMYFSAYGKDAFDPYYGSYYNQIYRAYSYDGINWTMNPTTPVVAAGPGGVNSYGTGAPSVVYKDGIIYMYYYSQYEAAGPYCYLRTSTDGVNFGPPTALTSVGNTVLDVKYIDSMNKWVGIAFCGAPGSGPYSFVSNDGINWTQGHYVAQDTNMYLNHNPGFIGTELGHGWANMYLTYGASQEQICPTEGYTQELEFSSWHIF